MEEEWLHIKAAILEAAKQSSEYEPIRSRTFNEDLKQIFHTKQYGNKIYLQTRAPKHDIKHKKLRAAVRNVTRFQ